MICPHCKEDNHTPCCYLGDGRCDAEPGARGITSCIHCYGELREVDGAWYHHSQFESRGVLLPCQRPQDYV